MSVIERHPRRTRGNGFGDVVLVVVLGAMALAVVVTVVVIAGGRDRAPQGPRGAGALDALQADITAAGLVVCERTDVADPRATDAVAARTLVVAVTCGEGQTATVQADAFVDDADRDAAARSIQGSVRPRASATVRTYGDLVVVVQGSAEDVVADRIDALLLAKGAA
ncbi:hypothetical protein [Actinomycetospora straminea]|uniref:Uncharacterized protein n=1 Tax=Actinomycetospora straminea TaxID=663607 RepID=A0ABP9E6T0_9PSEU|nr:hypothetical protein [Actinomycetospora straminea]MDD7934636.1 hypothetical protein [Actinomycetospora straminea]